MGCKAFKNRILASKLCETHLKWQKENSSPHFIQRRNWLEIAIRSDNYLMAQLNTEIPNSESPSFEAFEEIVPPVSALKTGD